MPVCKKIRTKKRQVCIGDLRDEIEIQNRQIVAPDLGDVDYEEAFSTTTIVFSAIETVSGQTIFDESNQERDVTHKIYIRYMAGVTAQTWIKFKDELYDILKVENLEERNEFLLLRCSKRGTATVFSNFA
jgi:SPP1 family predicted phage head-tail adaptor